jgi:hypothetical protein
VSDHLDRAASQSLTGDLEHAGRDPSGTMLSFYDMMKKTIVMPAHLMNDGAHVRC